MQVCWQCSLACDKLLHNEKPDHTRTIRPDDVGLSLNLSHLMDAGGTQPPWSFLISFLLCRFLSFSPSPRISIFFLSCSSSGPRVVLFRNGVVPNVSISAWALSQLCDSGWEDFIWWLGLSCGQYPGPTTPVQVLEVGALSRDLCWARRGTHIHKSCRCKGQLRQTGINGIGWCPRISKLQFQIILLPLQTILTQSPLAPGLFWDLSLSWAQIPVLWPVDQARTQICAGWVFACRGKFGPVLFFGDGDLGASGTLLHGGALGLSMTWGGCSWWRTLEKVHLPCHF